MKTTVVDLEFDCDETDKVVFYIDHLIVEEARISYSIEEHMKNFDEVDDFIDEIRNSGATKASVFADDKKIFSMKIDKLGVEQWKLHRKNKYAEVLLNQKLHIDDHDLEILHEMI